jgi:GT2 family glycosyltransferase
MDISVVILSYNTCDLLRACLRSVLAHAGDLAVETIVVDNASTDDSVAMVRAEFPGVRLIRSTTNLGFAGGNNRAFHACTGRFVLLLNSDAELHPSTLTTLASYLETHPRVGAVGPRLLNTDGSLQPSAFGFPTLGRMALVLTRLSLPLLGHTETGTIYRPETPRPVDWITGACLMVRRTVIEGVGPLDEGFFFDYEDVDWCRRIGGAGWGLHTVPWTTATHHRWQSKSQLSEQSLRGDDAACYYFRKHHGAVAERVIRALLVWFHACAWLKYGARAGESARMKRRRHRLGVLRFVRARRGALTPGPSPKGWERGDLEGEMAIPTHTEASKSPLSQPLGEGPGVRAQRGRGNAPSSW